MSHRHRNTLRRVRPHLPRSNLQAYSSTNGPGDPLGPSYSPPVGWIIPEPVKFDTTTFALTHVQQPGSRLFYLSAVSGVAPTAGVYYFWDGANIVDSTGSTTGVGGVAYGTNPMNPSGPVIPWKHWCACGPAGNSGASVESSWSEVGIRGASVIVGHTLMADSVTKRRRSPDWWMFKRGESFDLADDLIDYKTIATAFNSTVATLSLMGGATWRGLQLVGAYGPLTAARPKISNRLNGSAVNRWGSATGTVQAAFHNAMYMDIEFAGYIRDPSMDDLPAGEAKYMAVKQIGLREDSINVMFQGCLWNGCGTLTTHTSSNRTLLVTISTGSPAVLTTTTPHLLTVGRRLRCTVPSGAMPAPFLPQAQYWVKEVLSPTTLVVSVRPDPTSPAVISTGTSAAAHSFEIYETSATNHMIFHRCAVVDAYSSLKDTAHHQGMYYGGGQGGGRLQLSEMFVSQCGFKQGIKPSDRKEAICTISSNATPAVVTMAGHALFVGDPVVFMSTGNTPANIAHGTFRYYVKTVLSANTFTLSATPGGAEISSTSASTVRIATTVNDTLSGLAARDGVTPVAGDRVLARVQTGGITNGVYVASAGAWTRATDFDQTAEFAFGTNVFVTAGTVNANKQFKITAAPVTLGTNSMTWTACSTGVHTAVINIKQAGDGTHSAATTISTGTVFDRNLYFGGHVRPDLCWLIDSMVLRGASAEQFRGGFRLVNNFFLSGAILQGGFDGHPEANRTTSGDTIGNWLQIYKQSPQHPGWGFSITDGYSFSTVADNVVSYAQAAGTQYAMRLSAHGGTASGLRFTYGVRRNKIYGNHFESGVSEVLEIEDGLTTYQGSDPALQVGYIGPSEVYGNEYTRNLHITTSTDVDYKYVQIAPAPATNDIVYSNNASFVSRAAAQAAIGGTDWDRTLKTYLVAQGITVVSSDGVPEITKKWIDGQWRGNWDERWVGRAVLNYCRGGREKGVLAR